jgi:hypothetical protein
MICSVLRSGMRLFLGGECRFLQASALQIITTAFSFGPKWLIL